MPLQAVEAKQRIVIGADMSWWGPASGVVVEHPAYGDAVDLGALNAADRPAVPQPEQPVNSDSSVDVYFGPEPPTRKYTNWIQTISGKGWFTFLRLYGPLEPWFDKTCRPWEIEMAD